MNVLETILSFLTTLARIIFPRRKRPVAGDDLCPYPLPEPPIPPLPVERETEVTLAALGAILSLLSPHPRSRLARPLRLHPDAGRRDRGVFIRCWRDKGATARNCFQDFQYIAMHCGILFPAPKCSTNVVLLHYRSLGKFTIYYFFTEFLISCTI